MFLSNNRIGASDGLTVKRCVRGKWEQVTIRQPQAHADYVQSMNGVDRNDRDSADYLTTIWTNHCYLRIFCWGLDRVVHAVCIVVCFLAKGGVGKREWGRYDDKNNGWHDFQIDLAIALMNYGISTESKDTTEARPNFIRQTAFVPCNCRKYFFLLEWICQRHHKST
jgi:hypothetical protein